MTRTVARILEKFESLRGDATRRRVSSPRVLQLAKATHRDIALSNATVQLAPHQIAAIKNAQSSKTI